MTQKKIPLTREQLEDAARLKAIYLQRKGILGISQEDIADRLAISQGAVSHYLNGINALNLKAATVFAEMLNVPISDFSPSIEKERKKLAGKEGKADAISDAVAALTEATRDFSKSEMAELLAQIELIKRRKRGEL